MTSPFGKPGLSPEAVRDFLGRFIAAALEAIPEERRAAAAERFAQAIDAPRPKPAKAGEMILFGEAAEEELQQILRDVIAEIRAEAGDDPPPSER